MKKLFVVSFVGAVTAAAGSASAGLYWINSPSAPFNQVSGGSGQAKYRLSAANWDQSIDYGDGTNAGQFISAGLGNNTQLSARSYEFLFQHIPGQGFIHTLTDITNPAAPGAPSILSWGTFNAPTGGTSVPQINGIAPGESFNGLQVEARASREGSVVNWSDLSFTISGLTLVDGAWETSGSITPATQGSNDALGFNYQQLVSTVDLSQYDWTFRAVVQASRDNTASGDETVRFVVSAKNYIPTPGAAALLGLSGLVALRRRRA